MANECRECVLWHHCQKYEGHDPYHVKPDCPNADFHFGHELYYFILSQIHAEEWAEDRADIARAIEEAKSL